MAKLRHTRNLRPTWNNYQRARRSLLRPRPVHGSIFLKPGFHGHPDRSGGRCGLHRHKPRWQNDAHPHQRLQPLERTIRVTKIKQHRRNGFLSSIFRAGQQRQKQALQVPNSFSGIVWNPNGNEFYVAGGMNDSLHTYAAENGKLARIGQTNSRWGTHTDLGMNIRPMAAGVGDHRKTAARCVVADFENDAVTDRGSGISAASPANSICAQGKMIRRNQGRLAANFRIGLRFAETIAPTFQAFAIAKWW